MFGGVKRYCAIDTRCGEARRIGRLLSGILQQAVDLEMKSEKGVLVPGPC